MALYIYDQPCKYSPVYNEMIFVVTGTNVAQTNYQYILDVWLSGATTRSVRLKAPARPEGYGVFDVSDFLRSYVTHDLEISTSEGFKQNTNSFVSFDVKLGEEYGTTGTVYENIATSGTYYAYNGVFDYNDFVDYNENQWVVEDSTKKFLTNSPRTLNIGEDENAWLYIITSGTNSAVTARIATTSGNFDITNNYATIVNGNQMFLRIPVGTRNLLNVPNADLSTPQPIITSNDTSYIVTIRDSGVPLQASEAITFNIVSQCSKYDAYRIHFLNKLGGFDSFTFNKSSRQTTNIDRDSYKKTVGRLSGSNWSISKSDEHKRVIRTKLSDKLILNSDWITEETYQWLEELVSSPVVYWDNDSVLIPMTVSTSSYERKKQVNDKIFNLTIELEFTYDRYRQSY